MDRSVRQQTRTSRSADGQIREFDLPANSQPHGLSEDSKGSIWYTGIQKGVIGMLDPRTGKVDEYPIKEPGAHGPHTPIYDKRNGNLFFTLQSGHVGRINTETGDMVIKKTPSDNTYPYGIRINSQGVPWYVDFRGNRIGSVDPKTMEIKEYPLPSGDALPRRLTITSDDVIWYADFPGARWAGSIRRAVRSKNGRHREGRTPNRTPSRRSASDLVKRVRRAAKHDGAIRSEDREISDVRHSVGWRRLRHFEATAQGNIVTANSGVNKIGLVEIGTLAANRTN